MKRTPTHSAAASLLTSPPYQLPPPANLPEHLGLLRQEACRPVPEWRHVAAMLDWMLPPQVWRIKVIEERQPEMAGPQVVRVRFQAQAQDVMPIFEVLAS